MKNFNKFKSGGFIMKTVFLFSALALVFCFLSCDPEGNNFIPPAGNWVDITEISGLKNTGDPLTGFERGATISVPSDLYLAKDWIANEAAAANGNVSGARNNALGMIANATTANFGSRTIINGKLYQTIQLDAGVYRFDATLYSNVCTNNATFFKTFVVANKGNDLPDTFDEEKQSITLNIEQTALGYALIPRNGAPSNYIPPVPRPVYSTTFTLTETTTVSLGFVINQYSTDVLNFQTFFEKVELFQLQASE